MSAPKSLLTALILCLLAPHAHSATMERVDQYAYVPVMNMFTWYELNGRLKWIGPFGSTLLEDTRDFKLAHAEAGKVRKATYVKTVSLALTPVLLFSGVALLNGSSDAGAPMVALAFGSFFTYIGSDIYAKVLVARTARHYNREQSEYESFAPGIKLDFAFDGP